MKHPLLTALALASGIPCYTLPAAESPGIVWGQFRGPTAQGDAGPGKLPVKWSENEGVRWKTALPGEGWSSPVVGHGKVWMTTATEDGLSLRVLCVDLGSGKLSIDREVFRNQTPPVKHRRNSHASPTPVLEGDRVYVHFGALGTACLSESDGAVLWERRDLVVDFQNGAGGSPTLAGDLLLITFDGMDFQYEVGLDKMSGQTRWKTDRSAIPKLEKRPADMRKAYGTPVLVPGVGGRVSISTAAERIYAYDPATGRELWYVDYPGFSNVPLPVNEGSLLITATGFMKPEVWAIDMSGASGDANSKVLWKQNAGAPNQTSPLILNHRVYMVSSNGIASCLDAADGKILWKERIGADFAASPLLGGGRIYFFDCDGKTVVIEPGDTFREVARNQLAEGCMASPAVAEGALIVRTKNSLYRIE
jgi:outer membrane protein assembly factor BamB